MSPCLWSWSSPAAATAGSMGALGEGGDRDAPALSTSRD
jgi:hypothetical protein